MKAQSEHHHEVPVWTLNNFSSDEGENKRVWLGTKSNRPNQADRRQGYVRS